MATSIENLFETTAGAYSSVDAAFDVLTEFFSFGDDDITINETTEIKKERNNNRNKVKKSVKAYALSHAYDTVTQVEFRTIREQVLAELS